MATTGCQGVIGKVANVISKALPAIIEAGALLDAIDLKAKQHFNEQPNEELEKKYVVAMAKAKLTLSAASRLSEGTQQLDGANVEAAFKEYGLAFQEVMAIVGPLGVAAPLGDGTLQIGDGDDALMIPLPRAITLTKQDLE